jgi:excisionase family DNA binding protein
MGDQAVLRPASETAGPQTSAVTFERVLNTVEAAALLQIHPKTLQKMAREGTVPAFRIGDLWRFRASALDEWLRSKLGRRTPLESPTIHSILCKLCRDGGFRIGFRTIRHF